MRRLSLLRPGPARAYLASLAPSAAALARGPLADRHGVWTLATLTALMAGDWLNAREPASRAPLR